MPVFTTENSRNSIKVCLFIGLSFLWTGSCYLSWMYHLANYVTPSLTDLFTEVLGYLFQVLGIFLFAKLYKKWSSVFKNPASIFPLLLVMDLFSMFFSVLIPSLIPVLFFGFLMNLFHGCIAGFYLYHLSLQIPQQNRAIVFGGGYAIGSIGSWILSLIGSSNFLKNKWVLLIYLVLALLTLLPLNNTTSMFVESNLRAKDSVSPAPMANSWKILWLPGITILLLSLVKNSGFYFPFADLAKGGFRLEFSRIFYALGLICAGLINDKSRKYGAQCCLAALFFPFALFFLREKLIASQILWALSYLFFGFLAVYRVVVFSDISQKSGFIMFSGFGLLFGRLGDILGALIGLLSGEHVLFLLCLSGILFLVSVYFFFELYQELYFPLLSVEKSHEMLLEQFAEQYQFTPREKDVFDLITQGRSNSEIAGDLFVSENTIKYHMKNILKKTSCSNRIELMSLFKTISG